jgi:hypothetical protein
MNNVSIGWLSSALDEYHPRQMRIICFSWILSALDEYHPLQMSIICFSFSTFFSDSFGIGKTQILWKKVFLKIQDGGWKKSVIAAILKTFFYLPHMEYEGSIGLLSSKMKMKMKMKMNP